jgi:cytochrome P450
MPYLGRATVEVAGTLMFGRKFVAVAPAVLSDILELSRWADRRLGLPFKPLTHASWLISRSGRRAYNRLIGTIDKLVVETSERGSILAALFEATGQNAQAIRDQAITILLAGSETTTAATAWSLALLGQHPELQEKVALEGRSLPPPHDTRSADLDRLGLTRAVVKEAMRLYPPVWAITRTTRHPIDIGGYRFCHGSHVLISVYGIHRDNTLWEMPDAFDPRRFANGVHDPECYMPFGMGARRCIGLHFGLAETCILVARFLARLKVDGAQHFPRAIADLTLRPDRSIEMSVRSS